MQDTLTFSILNLFFNLNNFIVHLFQVTSKDNIQAKEDNTILTMTFET